MKFIVEIETGNEAMILGADISSTLIKVAEALNPEFDATQPTLPRKVYDLNGNPVGTFGVYDK